MGDLMKEVSEEIVKRILSRVSNDAKLYDAEFAKLTYPIEEFTGLCERDILRGIIPFLPNLNYRGRPLVMSASIDLSTDEIELIVITTKKYN